MSIYYLALYSSSNVLFTFHIGLIFKRSCPLPSKIVASCLQLDEWWEQPASTAVDWVAVDGQNVAAWHNHVKQLLAFYDKEFYE